MARGPPPAWIGMGSAPVPSGKPRTVSGMRCGPPATARQGSGGAHHSGSTLAATIRRDPAFEAGSAVRRCMEFSTTKPRSQAVEVLSAGGAVWVNTCRHLLSDSRCGLGVRAAGCGRTDRTVAIGQARGGGAVRAGREGRDCGKSAPTERNCGCRGSAPRVFWKSWRMLAWSPHRVVLRTARQQVWPRHLGERALARALRRVHRNRGRGTLRLPLFDG